MRKRERASKRTKIDYGQSVNFSGLPASGSQKLKPEKIRTREIASYLYSTVFNMIWPMHGMHEVYEKK